MSRWDQDRKVGNNSRDRGDWNGRGRRSFEGTRGSNSRSPPRERRIIKLTNSNRGGSSKPPGEGPEKNGGRSRSRSRDRNIRTREEEGPSADNGSRVRERGASPPPTRDDDKGGSGARPTPMEVETVNPSLLDERNDSSAIVLEEETGEIIEEQLKDSPIMEALTSPPATVKKDRWADSDDDDTNSDGGSEEEKHTEGNESDTEQGNGGKTKQISNGMPMDGASSPGTFPSLVATSPAVEGGVDNGSEAVAEVQPIEPAIVEYNPLLQGCRDVQIYEKLHKIAEGTYGVVYQAKEKSTGKICALKQVKLSKQLVHADGFPITAVREINIMLCLKHENIVEVQEMVISKEKKTVNVFMVMEYMEHDLKKVMDKMETNWTQSEAKCLLHQLLKAIHFMHEKWYMHRDLKTSNLLYNNKGKLCVCDFGLARKYGEPIREYTTPVVTLYYRSPELLMGARKYSTEIDMWSVGCIFAEILLKKVLFLGKCETSQLNKIFSILGNPTEERWPNYKKLPGAAKFVWKTVKPSLKSLFPPSSFAGNGCLSVNGFDLLERMLCLDPKRRITAGEALEHEYFKEAPRLKDMSMMPKVPETSIPEAR